MRLSMHLFTLFLIMTALVGCGGRARGKQDWGSMHSSSILASEFVTALNSVDGTSSTHIVKSADQTQRKGMFGSNDWFVIWDSKFDEYKAVSLDYIRNIYYYDYYHNNNAVAKEFRSIESQDIRNGHLNGDIMGDDYEVVTSWGSGTYHGIESGKLYEDQLESKDVSLAIAEKQNNFLIERSVKISYIYNVSIESAVKLVQLGKIIEKSLINKNSNQELSEADLSAFEKLSKEVIGLSLSEIANIGSGEKKSNDIALETVAKKLGTNKLNLEQKILPEIFGIML